MNYECGFTPKCQEMVGVDLGPELAEGFIKQLN